MEPLRALGRVFGEWGKPPDTPARVALVLAVLLLLAALVPPTLRAQRGTNRVSSRAFVALTAFAAGVLSLGYAAFYLRGGPRIIDATSYFLQGRALSEGHFAWSVPSPGDSFRGRFLLAEGDRIAGIFPPGYPLLLSFGFAVGAPMVVGPLLAAAIAAMTYVLGREVASRAGLARRDADDLGRLATGVGLASAALRYHTADTMAHGACALAFAVATWAVLRATRPVAQGDAQPAFFLVAGLALGYVAATRFGSAVALGAFVAWHALRARSSRVGALGAIVVGTLPGLALLAIAQASATGHALASMQSAYYRVSDGPPGCFQWGFGAGIGCLFEHGDFVRARLPHGYDALAAVGVTARRLAHHLTDVANLEPLALLPLAPLWSRNVRARRAASACLLLVGAQVIAYAPFYFDGDYPGGGARFFADVLPVEHVLLALGVATLAQATRRSLRPASDLVLAASLAGFAVHAAYAHESLRDRDGGAPMLDPSVLTAANLPRGALLFFDTDHGFNLAHDPEAAEHAARFQHDVEAPVVARLRNDDHDRLLQQRLGLPPTFVYHRRPAARTLGETVGATPVTDKVDLWQPPAGRTTAADVWRFEAENEWPPLEQRGGAWAEPVWDTSNCASPPDARRTLVVHAGSAGSVRIEVPIPRAGTWLVTPRVLVRDGGTPGTLALGEPAMATWNIDPPPRDPHGPATATWRCVDLAPKSVTTSGAALPLDVAIPACAADGVSCEVILDRTLVGPGAAPGAGPGAAPAAGPAPPAR